MRYANGVLKLTERRLSMKSLIFNVTPEKEKILHANIERFVRSQGHGGQKVNKTSSCVYLKHIPTGIEVKCQRERSQSLNRFLARRILMNKIQNMILGKESDEQQRIEKLKRQKRKRSKKAKEKVLRLKHLQSEKKKERFLKPDSSDFF